jgi:hypothetical protein
MKANEKDQREISTAVTHYYDSLTDQEMADDRAWGEFCRVPTYERVFGPIDAIAIQFHESESDANSGS